MTLKALKCAAAAALLAAAGTAGATTITFDSLTNPGLWQFHADDYVEQGYSFSSTLRNSGDALYSYGTASPFNADPAGATLAQNYDGYAILVSRVGGGSFTLNSFDLANGFDDANGGDVRFTYTDAHGTHDGQLTLADVTGLQTFTFDYTGVTSFMLWNDNFQVDNVKVEAETIPVPEPSSALLVLAGVAGLAGLARRRTR
jgi:hypothetical protein